MGIRTVFGVAVALLSFAAYGVVSAQEAANRERQPDWGPAGYELAEFYYIPAMDIYYDVGRAVFRIERGGEWVETDMLPESFDPADLYSCYKVVINGREPWLNHRNHSFVYERYRNKRFRQLTIRDERSGISEGERHNPKRERRLREREAGRRAK